MEKAKAYSVYRYLLIICLLGFWCIFPGCGAKYSFGFPFEYYQTKVGFNYYFMIIDVALIVALFIFLGIKKYKEMIINYYYSEYSAASLFIIIIGISSFFLLSSFMINLNFHQGQSDTSTILSTMLGALIVIFGIPFMLISSLVFKITNDTQTFLILFRAFYFLLIFIFALFGTFFDYLKEKTVKKPEKK